MLDGKKIGFIGAGKMGSSIIAGILSNGIVDPDSIIASASSKESLERLEKNFSIRTTPENREVVNKSDIIFLAVKPQVMKKVLEEISAFVRPEKLLISIAAGIPTSTYEEFFPPGTKIVRSMPNIAATVQQSASAVCRGVSASDDDVSVAIEILSAVGSAIEVPEKLMDVITGLAGSGPAFIFPVIEGMADGAVMEGLDRKNAIILAAQAVLGAAKLVLDTELHPGALKDMVTSPGGTTIQGIHSLEESGVRAAFINAVKRSTDKSRELGN